MKLSLRCNFSVTAVAVNSASFHKSSTESWLWIGVEVSIAVRGVDDPDHSVLDPCPLLCYMQNQIIVEKFGDDVNYIS